MKKLILATAFLAAVSLPSAAFAQSMQSTPAGAYACRTAKSGETANATMGSTQLTCTAVNMTKVHAAMDTVHGVMMKSGANADQMKQMQDAMTALSQALALPAIPGGLPNASQ
jgi:hypothetical protein